MRHVTDEDFIAPRAAGLLDGLRVTTQAEIWIGLHEHLLIDRTMRRVTRRATLAHRFMFENHALGLLAMTRGALFIHARHRETSRRFHDFETMRVMALHAVHFAFGHGMVLRKIELRVNFEMTGKTSLRIFAWIDDELPISSAHRDVFAARAMT